MSLPARHRMRLATVIMLLVAAGGIALALVVAENTTSLPVRGRALTLRLFGERGRQPVILSSGDGGWLHLAPHVANALASSGFFVVGVDSKEYLSQFTSGDSTLTAADVPGDFKTIVGFASGSTARPILAGVSEGAALSVLAATRDDVKRMIAGVLALGLPDKAELGWRWRDSLIYVTHGVPNEPTFSTASIVAGVAPVPVAAIHSSHDEFVPVDTVKMVLARAKEPKRLWLIEAADHAFTDKRAEFDARVLEAIAWLNASGK
jgi:type IV secretory pathway VirJ component